MRLCNPPRLFQGGSFVYLLLVPYVHRLLPGVSSEVLSSEETRRFAARMVSKEYVCLCSGQPFGDRGALGLINSPLLVESSTGSTETVKATWSSLGKEARTEYEVKDLLKVPKELGDLKEPLPSSYSYIYIHASLYSCNYI